MQAHRYDCVAKPERTIWAKPKPAVIRATLELPLMVGALALRVTLAIAVTCINPAVASAHPGGLNSEGCHNNRKTGEYHCHGGASRPARQPAQRQSLLRESTGATYFANCAAARAAGAAPVRRGRPGYRPGLDRDGDGVGCE